MSTDDPGHTGFRGSWTWLVLATTSRAYLVAMLTLVACAVVPVVLGWQGNVIRSGSMEPHIGVGDIVLTTSLPKASPVPVGRVVSFVNPAAAGASGEDTIRMHRIVRATDDHTFITAGDANRTVDSTAIRREQITGQGRLLIPWIGLPATWINTGDTLRLAIWLALTLCAVLVAGNSIPRRRRPDDSNKDNGGSAKPTAGDRDPAPSINPSPKLIATMTATTTLILTPLLLPVGAANAAFTADTTNAGNSFGVAVNKSTAKSTYQIYASAGTDEWYDASSVLVTLSATSGTSLTYRLNGGTAVTVRSTSALFTVAQQGDNTLTYYATDSLGRPENQHTVHIKLDNLPPTLTTTSRTTDSTHAQWRLACPTRAPSGGVCGTVTDASSGVASVIYVLSRKSDKRCFNGTTWTTAACSATPAATVSGTEWYLPVPDSTLPTAKTKYTLSIAAIDVAGNQSATATRTFSIG